MVTTLRAASLPSAIGLLVLATTAGGSLLSVVEQVSYLDGLWLAFSVVSTTGFADGPASPAGMLIAIGLFVVAAFGYLLLVMWAMSTALERHRRGSPQGDIVSERDVRRVLRNISAN